MSNALLLRLFTSEFFNSWIAVSYLFRYSDNVGIQHYLCTELKRFPISEIEFFLPQLIHLLIISPSESIALECFMIEMCEKSTHIALMTLWYLQAYLSDLSANPTSPSFQLCKRLLNRAQAIVFSEDATEEDKTTFQKTQKVRENALPALVGMSAMLLGIGQPRMTKPAGRIAIAQGRKVFNLSPSTLDSSERLPLDEPPALSRRNTTDDTQYNSQHQSPSKLSTSSLVHSSSFISTSQPDLPIRHQRKKSNFNLFTHSPSLEDLHRGKAFSVSRYIKTAQHKINRKMIQLSQEVIDQHASSTHHGSPLNPKHLSSSSSSSDGNKKRLANTLSVFDPKLTALGQSSVPTNPSTYSPVPSQYSSSEEAILSYASKQRTHQSSHLSTSLESVNYHEDDRASIFSTSSSSSSSSSTQMQEITAENKMSMESCKTALLRSNYFRSEMQFLLALVDIATRLVIVPKPARMSALQAELTLLNHNLPAEICLPLWCPATVEKPYHHRVVRISPSDAVVLNSAERAPYLLMIEVLDDEMSFEDAGRFYRIRRQQLKKLKKKKKRQQKEQHQKPAPVSAGSGSMSSADMADCLDSKEKQTQHQEEESGTSSAHLSLPLTPTSNKAGGQDDYADRMRTAAVMLAQLQSSTTTNKNTEQIRQKIIKEMVALEEQRMKKMKTEGVGSGVGGGGGEGAGGDMLEDEQRIAWVVNKEDPSAAVLSEDWETKKERLRAASPYGHLPNWRLISVIVKNGSDLRQEQFAIQLIREMQRIWEDTGVNVWVKYYRVLVTSDGSGLIETLKNTISIHSIKKDAYTRGWNQKGAVFTLHDYFEKLYGSSDSDEFIKAQDAFMQSLAGYSIACYLLQIKDRHNGNLLLDDTGHLIHIDFGFMLSNSPGSVGFEMAPFKLSQEYIDLLGGFNGEKFAEYKALMKAAFLAVRKHSENILLLTEMMSKDSKLPCFQNGDLTVAQLRDRFQLHLTEPQAEEFVDRLIMSSCCNVFTRLYDTFQYYSQGIL